MWRRTLAPLMLVCALAGGCATAPAPAPSAPSAVRAGPDFAFYQPDTLPRATGDPAATVAEGSGVVSAADPRASAAGVAMLARGGTASDAAIATMLALSVVEPQSSGIGGGGFLLHFDPQTGDVTALDGRETAPAAAGPDWFTTPDGRVMSHAEAVPGGRSVGVPGAVALAAEAHRRWGRLPWAELFAPAIALAEEGFLVTERLERFTAARVDLLSPDARAVFLDGEGRPWAPGHRLMQPAKAASLRLVAEGGAGAFHRGPLAEAIVRAVSAAARNPAPMTLDDLAGYRVAERAPLCRAWQGRRLCTMGPPSAGGIAVLQTLGILEDFDLAAGPGDARVQHLVAEALRLAMADREAWGADGDFVAVPSDALVSDAYVARRRGLVSEARAMVRAPPGVPVAVARAPAEVPATSHLSVGDAQGSAVALTATIEGPFGSGLMAAGILLNNELTDFDRQPLGDGRPAPNRVEAGKRPRSSMAPVLLIGADGRVEAALGAAGGATIIAQVAKALLGLVAWGLPVEQALAGPQLVADARGVRLEQGSTLEALAAELAARGHDPRPAVLPLKANAVVAVPGGWRGAADPRSEGRAMAVAP